MNRRTVLRALGTGLAASLAGCSGSRVDGRVASNETPLSFSHEYATQATYSGTRVFVEVIAENAGTDPITLETRAPNVTCTFLDDDGETLHEAGVELVEPLAPGESKTLEFPLTIDTEDVTQYELRCEWVETQAKTGEPLGVKPPRHSVCSACRSRGRTGVQGRDAVDRR